MLQDRAIDATTGDYIDDGHGGYVYTVGADTAVRHAVTGRPWWGDASGTDVDDLAHLSIDEAVAKFRPQLDQALQPLVDAGVLRSFAVEVGVDPRVRSRRVATVVAYDATGNRLELSDLVPFGSR
jgi:phage gp46-like protein